MAQQNIDFEAMFAPQEAQPEDLGPTDDELEAMFLNPDAPVATPDADIGTPEEVEQTLAQKLAGIRDRATQNLSDTMASYGGLTVAEDEIMEGVEGFGNARQIEAPEALLQALGGSAGALAEGLVTTAAHKIPEEAKEQITQMAMSALTTVIGQRGMDLMAEGGKAWEGFKKAHPETAKTLMSAVEIGTLALPAAKTGGKMIAKGQQQVTKRYTDMIQPIDKIAAGTGRGGRTVERGAIRRARTYEPGADDIELAKFVEDVPNAKSTRTATYNQEHVQNEVSRLAQELDDDIVRVGNPIFDKDSYMDDLGRVVEDFEKSEEALTLTGDAANTSKKILLKSIDIIDDSDGTARGLLQARRDLDKWLGENPGKAYDPQVVNAKNAAMKVIRDNINDKVDSLVPDVKVKDKLRHQHKLLRANDYLTDTMRAEGEDVFDRFMKKLSKGHVGPVGAATSLSFLGGLLGMSTGATVGGGALGGAAVYAAYKAANSATRRKVLGHILQKGAMSKADKMLLVDMLQQEATDGDAGRDN